MCSAVNTFHLNGPLYCTHFENVSLLSDHWKYQGSETTASKSVSKQSCHFEARSAQPLDDYYTDSWLEVKRDDGLLGSVWAKHSSVASVQVTIVCVHWLKHEQCEFACCEAPWSSVAAAINICQCRSVSGLTSLSSKLSRPSSACTLCTFSPCEPSKNMWFAAKSARLRYTNTRARRCPHQASETPGCCLLYPPHFKLGPLQQSGVKPPLALTFLQLICPKAAFTHVCIPAIKP